MAPPLEAPKRLTPFAPSPPRAALPRSVQLLSVLDDCRFVRAPASALPPELPTAWLATNLQFVMVARQSSLSRAPLSAKRALLATLFTKPHPLTLRLPRKLKSAPPRLNRAPPRAWLALKVEFVTERVAPRG